MTEYVLQIAAAFYIGFVLDCILGDPYGFPHSINLIGNSIRKLEKIIRGHLSDDKASERKGGVILVLIMCTLSFMIPFGILAAAYSISRWLCLAVQTEMIWQIIAARTLAKESGKVYSALKNEGLESGRKSVAMIVGRDTAQLTEEGVIKACVETVAENTSDGVIAPMLFIFLGGAPAGYLYKAINTMDSIIGYKNEKYIYFGTAAAKLDDAANFIPARLSAAFMIAASFLLGFDGKNAIRIFRRDRHKHASPNSAQTESVCAGALGTRLAGDAKYFGKIYKKDYIGDPLREIEPEDILKSHRLMYGTTIIGVVILTVIWTVILL